MLDKQQFQELLLQSLEHERGGVKVYETAVECAIAPDLKREWQKYLEQTRNHVRILERVLQKLEIDPEQPTPGREIVAALGASLVAAMQQAQGVGNPNAAQILACECVVLAETKDHYHSRGYCRELWLDSLGLPAVLPPPEETQHVKSAISAAQAQQQSERNR